MTDNKSRESRRKLLKSIAAGSGAIVTGKSLPESWSRPVVDSIMLPAHAQTSPTVYAANLATLAMLRSEIRQAGNDRRLINALIPDANAEYEDPVDYLCITVLGGVFNGHFAREYSPEHIDEYSNSGGTLGNALELSLFSGCGNGILPPMLTVSNPTATGVDFTLDYGSGPVNGTLPLGDCSIVPESVCLLPSDIAIKDNFSSVDEQEILRKVASLPVKTWNYSNSERGVRHIGPMAQDFMESFNVGGSDRHIHMVDANGVNLAAIKALNTKLKEKDAQIKNLQEQLAIVMKRLDSLA